MDKPKPNYLNIILISLAFVLFIVSVFYLGRQSVKTIPNPITVLPQTTAIPTSVTDPIQNWKTYTDSKNIFSFDYPSSWNANKEALLETGNYVYISSPNQSIFLIDITEDNSKTISEYLSKKDKQNSTEYEGTSSIAVISTKKTVIAGLNCIQRQENYNAAGFSVFSTYFKNGNNIYVLTLQPKEGVINSNDINIYQEILSTFKFTENIVNLINLPNSKELQIDVKDYSAYFIFNNKKYIFDKKPVDYPGQLIFSPNKKFACIEYGTSGYWGYTIFDLQQRKTLLSGIQSSYCLNWSKTNQLNVKEIPYDQNITNLYSINPETLQKTVVNP